MDKRYRKCPKQVATGLSKSNKIVKKHNGDNIADSEIGMVTAFTVKLPVAEDNNNG